MCLVAYLKISHIRDASDTKVISTKSAAVYTRVSPREGPLWRPGPPNQIPANTFYIFPSIRDFTHSFRFDPPVFLILHAFPRQVFAVTKCHRNFFASNFCHI